MSLKANFERVDIVPQQGILEPESKRLKVSKNGIDELADKIGGMDIARKIASFDPQSPFANLVFHAKPLMMAATLQNEYQISPLNSDQLLRSAVQEDIPLLALVILSHNFSREGDLPPLKPLLSGAALISVFGWAVGKCCVPVSKNPSDQEIPHLYNLSKYRSILECLLNRFGSEIPDEALISAFDNTSLARPTIAKIILPHIRQLTAQRVGAFLVRRNILADVEMIRALRSKGAAMTEKDHGRSIFAAARFGFLEAVHELKPSGLQFSGQWDALDRLAVEGAVEGGHLELVKRVFPTETLIFCAEEIELFSWYAKRVVSRAIMNGDSEMMHELLRRDRFSDRVKFLPHIEDLRFVIAEAVIRGHVNVLQMVHSFVRSAVNYDSYSISKIFRRIICCVMNLVAETSFLWEQLARFKGIEDAMAIEQEYGTHPRQPGLKSRLEIVKACIPYISDMNTRNIEEMISSFASDNYFSLIKRLQWEEVYDRSDLIPKFERVVSSGRLAGKDLHEIKHVRIMRNHFEERGDPKGFFSTEIRPGAEAEVEMRNQILLHLLPWLSVMSTSCLNESFLKVLDSPEVVSAFLQTHRIQDETRYEAVKKILDPHNVNFVPHDNYDLYQYVHGCFVVNEYARNTYTSEVVKVIENILSYGPFPSDKRVELIDILLFELNIIKNGILRSYNEAYESGGQSSFYNVRLLIKIFLDQGPINEEHLSQKVQRLKQELDKIEKEVHERPQKDRRCSIS